MKKGDQFKLKDGSLIQLVTPEKGEADTVWTVSNVSRNPINGEPLLGDPFRLSTRELALNVI